MWLTGTLSEPNKLNHGANVEAKNEYGSTPLMTAAASGFSSAAEMVFRKKCFSKNLF